MNTLRTDKRWSPRAVYEEARAVAGLAMKYRMLSMNASTDPSCAVIMRD
jgi:hypothetical protein